MVAKPMAVLGESTLTNEEDAAAAGIACAPALFAGVPAQAEAHLHQVLEGARRRHDLLARTIETEVVPRLLLAQRPVPAAAPPAGPVPRAGDVEALAELLIGREAAPAERFVEELQARGTTIEQLYMELLTPAARLLGEYWQEDRCHFTDVTLGLWRLQQMLHALSPAFLHECETCPGDCRRALLAALPGEQHTFGLGMVAEFLRRAGWDVHCEPSASGADLTGMVRRGWYAVIGLTASSEARLDAMAATIRAVRRASRNPAVGVMVGGPLFLAHPDFVGQVGADATAADGRQAVIQAERLLSLLVDGK